MTDKMTEGKAHRSGECRLYSAIVSKCKSLDSQRRTEMMERRIYVCGHLPASRRVATREKAFLLIPPLLFTAPRALVEESDSSDWFIKFSRYGGHV